MQIGLDGRVLQVHRVIWYLHHGIDPGNLEVDHINRDPSDNRIANLRLVDGKANRANSASADKPVEVIYPDGSSHQLPSVMAAARFLGCARSSMYRYIRGTRQHPSGIRVSYL
jgi:hypothetical protein